MIPGTKRIKWLNGPLLIAISILAVACTSVLDATLDTGSSGTKPFVSSVTIEAENGDYYAVVRGEYPDTCSTRGDVDQEVEGKTIKVTLYTARTEDTDCEEVSTPFEDKILLDVSGLLAGQYGVEVNGVVTTLTLTEDQ
jgi:hypothetical protein